MLHTASDEVAIVLFGTQGTQNDLASGGGYSNITVLSPMGPPSVDMLLKLEEVSPGRAQADCMLVSV